MLNESKVKLMTKMAIYEKHEGKKDIRICRYFKGDYIALGLLKNGIAVTIAYLLCLAVYFVCNVDFYLKDIAKLDYNNLVVSIGKYYLIALIIFSVIGYVVYTFRYEKAHKNIEGYSKRLRKLEKYYNKQSKSKERK